MDKNNFAIENGIQTLIMSENIIAIKYLFRHYTGNDVGIFLRLSILNNKTDIFKYFLSYYDGSRFEYYLELSIKHSCCKIFEILHNIYQKQLVTKYLLKKQW